ncbi:MAG: hypothetical protein JW876_04085 [Candidatus Krumholzibacteriota bacterium]|nr:hypothetical protein [Candidatus Krumholzibacteriota bacterium]
MEETPREEIVGEAERPEPGERSRWIAAVAYVPFVCFFSLSKGGDDPFVHYHARQGVLLLVAEVALVILAIILELTLGRLRLFGLIVVGLVQLVTSLAALVLAVMGFVKALFGEYWHLPLLGEHAHRVPGLGAEDR